MIKYILPLLICSSCFAHDWHSYNEKIENYRKWDRFLFYNEDGEIQIGTLIHYPSNDGYIMYIDTCGHDWHKAKWWTYLPESPEVLE